MKLLKNENLLIASGIGLGLFLLTKYSRKATKKILCIEVGG